MAQAVIANTFEDALAEAKAYNRMGALDDDVIRDIAFDYDVDEDKLRDALGEPWFPVG